MEPIRRVRLRATIAIRLCATLVSLALAACQSKLPESDSPAARLYVERCSGCHVAYNPRSMTAAMWAAQVKSMEDRCIRQSGLPPLTLEQEKTILDYLTRNAASQ